MVQYSLSARRSTMCSQECRENLMKFSKDRSAACVTEKKSVGEKGHLSVSEVGWPTILERSCCWAWLLG